MLQPLAIKHDEKKWKKKERGRRDGSVQRADNHYAWPVSVWERAGGSETWRAAKCAQDREG